MKKHLVLCSLGLLLGLPLWAAGQECASARQAYDRLALPLQGAAFTSPTVAEQRGVQVQDFLTRQIHAQLETGPAESAALRVQHVQQWLHCVQQDHLSPDRSNVPWAAALDTTGNVIAVAEYIPLGVYASFSRAWLQVWFMGPDQQWDNAVWARPGSPYATFHAWILQSPAPGEHWLLASAVAIRADGNNQTRVDVLSWKQGQMRTVWSTPGEGVFHTQIVTVTPVEVTLRSSFGVYAHCDRDLLRTLVITPNGVEQTEARFVYFPERPLGAPEHPQSLVPLTEPDYKGAPTKEY